MSSPSKVQKSITIVEYLLQEKQERIEKLAKKTVQSQDEKIFIGQEVELIENVRPLMEMVKKGFDDALGRYPPHAYDLEEAVLGAIILETPALSVVDAFLEPDHFFKKSNRIVYEMVKSISEKGKPVDMRTVVVELRKTGQLDLVGGAFYIAELTSKVSSAANIEYHARILVEFAIKRNLIVICSKIFNEAYADSNDCFELLEELETELTKIKSWIK